MKHLLWLPLAAGLCALLLSTTGCKPKGGITPLPRDTTVKLPDTTATVVDAQAYDTSADVVFTEAKLDDDLERLVAEKLRPVYFEYNSSSITSASTENLAAAGAFVNSRPSLRILVEGNCDDRGSSDYNMGLGEQRAKAVKDYLITYGVEGTRIETTSWGKEHLAESGCASDECHAKNRRATFKVLTK